MLRLNYPVSTVCPALAENRLFLAGGGGKAKVGRPNTVSLVGLEDYQLRIFDEAFFDETISLINTYNDGETKYIALFNGPTIQLYGDGFDKLLGSFDTNMTLKLGRALHFSESGKTLVAVDGNSQLYIFSLPEFALLYTSGKNEYHRACIFKEESEGLYIVVATTSCVKLLLFNEEINVVAESEPFDFLPKALCVDGESIFYAGLCSKPKQTPLIELKHEKSKLVTALYTHPTSMFITAMKVTKTSLVIGTHEGDVLILNKNSLGRQRVAKKIHGFAVTSLGVIDKYILSGSIDATAMLTPNSPKLFPFYMQFSILLLVLAILIGLFRMMQ